MSSVESTTGSDGALDYRQWTIALGVTTAVFLVTTLLLACILFVVVCRKIVRLKKEREARVTGIVEGPRSPHWIDNTKLNDMLSQERDNPEKQPQNIWSISTQTFERNQHRYASQPLPTVAVPQVAPSQHVRAQISTTTVTTNVSESATNSATVSSGGCGAVSFNAIRETDDGEKRTCTTPVHMAGSPTTTSFGQQQRGTKPNRNAPQPPPGKMQKKSTEQNGVIASTTPNDAECREPMPYVYPMHKLNPKLKTKDRDTTARSGGNQSHEYAQPHALLQERNALMTSSVGSNKTRGYSPIDPKLKQPTGPYQDLLVNGMPRGQSLPTISTFATLS